MSKLLGWFNIDGYLFGTALILVAIGIATIYTVTVGRGDQSLAFNQAIVAVLGIVLAVILSRLDYRRIRSLSIWWYLGGILLLAAVLVGGKTVFGATRWIQLPGFQLQPSELMKLLSVIMTSALLAAPRPEITWQRTVSFIASVGLPVGFIIAQPDLGTAVTLVGATGLLFVIAHPPKAAWIVVIVSALLALPVIFLNLHGYQLDRLRTFLEPASDPQGKGYNVLQSLIAVGNGRMFGQGFGHGTQTELSFLPVAHTDFIFAGIAEATGLVGSVIVLLLFGILIGRALIIARRALDRFGYLLAAGIASLWLVQFSVNVAMNLGMAPVTGIPLPFVSHGGTALIANFAALGIVLSVAARQRTSLGRIR